MGKVEQLEILERGRDEIEAHFEPGIYIRDAGVSLSDLWSGEPARRDDYAGCALGCLYVAFAGQKQKDPDDKWLVRKRLDDAAGALFPQYRLPAAVPDVVYRADPRVSALSVLDAYEEGHASTKAIAGYLDELGDDNGYFGIEAVAELGWSELFAEADEPDPRKDNVLACFDRAIATLERELQEVG